MSLSTPKPVQAYFLHIVEFESSAVQCRRRSGQIYPVLHHISVRLQSAVKEGKRLISYKLSDMMKRLAEESALYK